MSPDNDFLRHAQYWVALVGLAGSCVVVATIMLAVVRKGAGPFIDEFVLVGFSSGVALWALKYVAPERTPELEMLSIIGFAMFLMCSGMMAVRHRKKQRLTTRSAN